MGNSHAEEPLCVLHTTSLNVDSIPQPEYCSGGSHSTVGASCSGFTSAVGPETARELVSFLQYVGGLVGIEWTMLIVLVHMGVGT